MKTSGVLDFEEKATASSTSFSEKTAPSIIEFLLKKLPGKDPESLLLSENPLFEFQLPAAPILPIKSKAHRFWLNVEAASVLSIRKNLDEIPAGLAFPERYTRPGNGWQVGISLATEPLKNWRVALGMQHLRQTHESAHSASLRLMDGVCLNPHDPGLKEYEFSYTVVSSGKQSDLTLRLQQQNIGSTMPDDEPFSLYMETVHHSAVWRVPLTVERQFGTGKWLAFVRGGAVVDFFGRNTVQITHFSEACQDLCFQSGYSPMIQVSAANKAAFGWLAGAGIERQVYSRVALRVEPFAVGQKGSIQCGLSLGLLFSN